MDRACRAVNLARGAPDDAPWIGRKYGAINSYVWSRRLDPATGEDDPIKEEGAVNAKPAADNQKALPSSGGHGQVAGCVDDRE
jgi:hypothetical protein